MATSGSNDYSVHSDAIVTEALELLGVLGEGEGITDAQYISSARTLNMMVKNWQAAGLNLFAVQPAFLFLKKGQQEYHLSSTSPDHATPALFRPVITVAAPAGSSSITATNLVGMIPGTKIGIQLSTNTDMFWTTILSVVDPVINLAAPLPGNVNVGAAVYAYNIQLTRPMRVLEAYIRRSPNSPTPIDIPMGLLSRVDYGQLATKTTQSQPLQLYFDPQRTDSRVRIWPVADNEVDYIILVCQRTLDDFDTVFDEPDYPQEWFLPLAYNLAVLLAPKYGTPVPDYARLQQLAAKFYEDAFDWDAEQGTSVYFKPDNWGMDIGRRGN